MPPLPSTITFDGGTISDDLFWGGTTTTPGSVVNRADAVGGTTKALQYPDINDDEETFFEIYVVAAPGDDTLTVRYEVSSEENYDYFRILVDEADVLEPGEPGVSGDGAGWQEFTTTLSHGSRTLRFSYSKDSSADEGDDTTWISSITVPPIAPKPSVGASTLADLTGSASGETEIFSGYRFWRIYTQATGSISGNSGGIGEVELRASLGGADLTDSLPGIASQPLGTPDGSFPASNAFDNSLSTSWFANTEYSSLQWEFTTLPQDVAQVRIRVGSVYHSELLDLSIDRSYGGDTWETIATKRGIVEAASHIGGDFTINLIDPTVPRDGFLGINDFGATISSYIFCQPDFVSVVAHTTSVPIVIERLISYSSSVHPLVIGATTYPFSIRGVIYAADGALGAPGTLLTYTAERTSVPNDWFELFLPAPLILAPGSYYLGVQVGGTSGGLYGHQTVGSNTRLTVAATYASGAPASFPGGSSALAQNGAIYAIYPISTGAASLESAVSAATGVVGSSNSGAALLEDLTSAASGAVTAPITGTATAALEALTGSATGTRLRPGFGVRVSLMGTLRPTKSLNATWVPK
jgi:hypothetical protein